MIVHLLRSEHLVLDDSPLLGFNAGIQIALDAVHSPVKYPGGDEKEEAMQFRTVNHHLKAFAMVGYGAHLPAATVDFLHRFGDFHRIKDIGWHLRGGVVEAVVHHERHLAADGLREGHGRLLLRV